MGHIKQKKRQENESIEWIGKKNLLRLSLYVNFSNEGHSDKTNLVEGLFVHPFETEFQSKHVEKSTHVFAPAGTGSGWMMHAALPGSPCWSN
jgi:hypothetical protein